MNIFLWALSAFLMGSFTEWMIHRFILHNFKIKCLSSYHFGRHHRNTRQNEGFDKDYTHFPPLKWSTGLHEIITLIGGMLIAIPFAFLSGWLWFFLCMHAFLYYYLHRRMHLHPTWGKRWFPWHFRHHMGKDQNANWGVTNPLFDHIFGTVKK